MLFTKKTIVSFFIAFLFTSLGMFLKKLNLNVIEITEREKCPACFGISMCPEISNDKIHFEYTDFYSFFNNLFGIKNVYYGRYEGKKVIMKKLAHNSELDVFDEMICKSTELLELCYNKPQLKGIKANFYKLVQFELAHSNMTDPNNKLIICPTMDSIEELFINLQIKHEAKNDVYHKYLWTSIKINPEPIILEILSAKDGWPTPEYFGACGRLIIQEYIGLPLSSFIEEPWIKRAKIASSLLDAAYLFTFRNPKFSFYLTDISVDNIAVNNNYRAIFVDLENVIIVDKYPPVKDLYKFKTWNQIYVNDVYFDCQDCFVFSPSDICSHKISDHNYYAICQLILLQTYNSDVHFQGFLHDLPNHIFQEYPELIYLLKQCSKPDALQSRIDIGIRLKKLLDIIIKNME